MTDNGGANAAALKSTDEDGRLRYEESINSSFILPLLRPLRPTNCWTVNRWLSNVQLSLAHPLDDGGVAVREEAAGACVQIGNLSCVVRIQFEIEDRQILGHAILSH